MDGLGGSLFWRVILLLFVFFIGTSMHGVDSWILIIDYLLASSFSAYSILLHENPYMISMAQILIWTSR